MIRSDTQIEDYLDHNFISPGNNGGVYVCEKCKLRVCIRLQNCYVVYCSYLIEYPDYEWKDLKLYCDEVIIKNIIE